MTPEEEETAEIAIVEALELDFDNESNVKKFWEATRKMQRHITLLDIQAQIRRLTWLGKVREFIVE